jgi:hypothetical protein
MKLFFKKTVEENESFEGFEEEKYVLEDGILVKQEEKSDDDNDTKGDE